MKRLRVTVLMLEDFVPPPSIEGLTEKEIAPWKTEYDVLTAVEALGHEAQALGVSDDLGAIRDGVRRQRPHIVFNLLEEFHGLGGYVPYVLGYFELNRQAYTGCNPYGLLMARNKALTKKLLKHHRVRTPDFAIFPIGRVVRPPKHFRFPAIVKSTTEQGSVGISQASIVANEEKLKERVGFVHEQLGTDAIVEEYIEGRELYLGVIGNRRVQSFPVWEMVFDGLPEGAPHIATEKIKWDLDYQVKRGIITRAAVDLPPGVAERIGRVCKRVYRILGQTGYARLDMRLTEDGKVYVLECNPNPQLSYGEDFAESAHAVGVSYEQLLHRIINLGLRYHDELKRGDGRVG